MHLKNYGLDLQISYNMLSDFPQRPFLSIIIPAYNEEERLPHTFHEILSFIEHQDFTTEVLIVNNASTDRSEEIITDFLRNHSFFQHIYEPRRGKGAAVRTGVLSAQGEYILICDADMATPIEEASKFLPPQLDHFDVAIGSREAPGAHRYGEPFYRHLMGRIFNIIVQWLVLPGIRDSQCGFKCFRRTIANDLFSASTLDGWAFDVEILYIAFLRGYKIIEVPVNWSYGEKSKVNPFIDSFRMLRDVVKVRQNGREGKYKSTTSIESL
jgi:dolichyl-phosphate beta-glucosyltransferase